MMQSMTVIQPFVVLTRQSSSTLLSRSLGRRYSNRGLATTTRTTTKAAIAKPTQPFLAFRRRKANNKPVDQLMTRSYSTTGLRNVAITYVEPDGTEKTVEAAIGQNLLDVAHENGVELEGACGGELACSTCHLIFEPAVYDSLPPKQDEEEDMLDLAFEVTETSRLGCQIIVREDFDGIKVKIPDDGF